METNMETWQRIDKTILFFWGRPTFKAILWHYVARVLVKPLWNLLDIVASQVSISLLHLPTPQQVTFLEWTTDTASDTVANNGKASSSRWIFRSPPRLWPEKWILILDELGSFCQAMWSKSRCKTVPKIHSTDSTSTYLKHFSSQLQLIIYNTSTYSPYTWSIMIRSSIACRPA